MEFMLGVRLERAKNSGSNIDLQPAVDIDCKPLMG